MKYQKIIQASSRKNIMERYVPVPVATPPVVDEDLPEPTEEETNTEDDDSRRANNHRQHR